MRCISRRLKGRKFSYLSIHSLSPTDCPSEGGSNGTSSFHPQELRLERDDVRRQRNAEDNAWRPNPRHVFSHQKFDLDEIHMEP